MRSLAARLCALCAALLPAPAIGQQVRPLADFRLRYEGVSQDGLPERSDALTARLHAGAEVSQGPWSALVEGEATLPLLGRYFDGLNGRTDRPIIADPGNLQLNRAQVRYAVDGIVATAGRQTIAILDQRFVGSAPFRQNDQSFDAVRVQLGAPDGPTLDVSYAWQALGVNGARGRGARPDGISGNNLFAVAGLPTPVGTLSPFAFLVDQDEATVQTFRLSSQSYGVRLSGTRPLGGGTTLAYVASWARQRDLGRNPNRYDADYLLGEASVGRDGLTGTLGYEVLGADDGRPFTSFQTPLASLFKFHGWTDRFVTTPPDGLRDLYARLGYGWRPAGVPVNLSAGYHRFRSDRMERDYGTGWNLLATARFGRTLLAARYARYDADGFASDTEKLWLSLDWSL